MTRLNVTVEGETEQEFAVRLLQGHLADYSVYMEKPRKVAHARKGGVVHRGGPGSYDAFKNDMCRWLKQEHGPDVFFTTMIDLYGLRWKVPGRTTPAEKRTPTSASRSWRMRCSEI